MSFDDFGDFSEWFRRQWRRFPFFSGSFFEDIDRMMEEMFKDFQQNIPRELVEERKMPDGSVFRRVGPIVYGYSMTLGPDGKPVIREFGNMRPQKSIIPGMPKHRLEVKAEREPLIDTIDEDDQIKVVAEVPGVEKDDINLEYAENSLIISVDTEKRKYYKEVELPEQVDPETAKASYRNGVLEITVKKKKVKPKGQKIRID
ncbi:MAG: archaeal heat shock protein Hsp20 [Candidatus Bathyarchaeia archaeon]